MSLFKSLIAAVIILIPVGGVLAQTACQSTCGGPGQPVEGCGGGCPGGYTQEGNCCCQVSPIIVDVYGEGFHLTSAEDGVPFRAFAEKAPSQLSWTDEHWRNGWLVLDRNGNGTIDDLTELFGNLTQQPPSGNRNGFLALAVFDEPSNGGNNNAYIDAGDSVYDRLRIWIDTNHNGISEPNELHSLRDLEISRISLKPQLSQRVDKFGNKFRYKARIWDAAGNQHALCYDVFLK